VFLGSIAAPFGITGFIELITGERSESEEELKTPIEMQKL
jgi:hypothetical protein